MDFGKINALYVFRPLTSYLGHDKILQKCRKLRKEHEGKEANETHEKSVPQIRDYWEEFQDQLDQKGKWWGSNWSRYHIRYADLENAFRNREFELLFYRNLLIVKFSPQAPPALKEVMLHKALENELEVVPE